MKWKIISIIIILMLPIVLALETCKDNLVKPSDIPCIVLTPVIGCGTYTYEIFNQTTSIENGSLTLIKDQIYSFTFNQSDGDYLIRLCDNSTREIIVDIEEDEMLIGIGIVLAIAIGVLIFMGYIFFKEDSWIFYLSFLCWYIALLMPLFGMRVMANADGISANISTLMETAFIIYLWCYVTLLIMLIVYFLILTLTWLAWWKKVPAYKKKKLKDTNY